MTNQGPADDRVDSTDDLDRAFGPDTASIATASTGQRLRRGTVITLSFVAAGVVIAVVLSTIVGSIQTGVGGVFPRPQAALDRFRTAATEVAGVRGVRDEETTHDSLAAYRVSAVVDAAPGCPTASRWTSPGHSARRPPTRTATGSPCRRRSGSTPW